MSKFKVDKEQVESCIDDLRKLLDKCEEAYERYMPVSENDKGKTHDELEKLCENTRQTCYDLGQLINNTILFLGETNEMFEQSDQNGVAVMSAAKS